MTDKPTVMLSKEVVFQLAKKLIEKGDADAFNSQFMLMTRQMFERVEQSISQDERQAVLADLEKWLDNTPDAFDEISKQSLRAKLGEMKEGK